MATKKKRMWSKEKAKKPVKRVSSKLAKKQLKTISKKLKKTTAKSLKERKKLKKEIKKGEKGRDKINAELKKLQADLKKFKAKKTSKKRLNEYNLFMRRQLLAGKTFNQAARLWKKLRRVEREKLSAKTRIKTVVKRVRVKAKSRLKPKPKIKTRTRTAVKSRTIIRKPKPIIKYRIRTKVVEKPVVRTVEKPVLNDATIQSLAEQIARETVQRMRAHPKPFELPVTQASEIKKATAVTEACHDLPTEEIAYRMVKMYFEELARTGFKRKMRLDDLVDAFVYAWSRVEKQVGRKEKRVHNEEMAYRLVNLYFIELARIGHKRTLNLDELLKAYFYVLKRLEKNNASLIQQMEAVARKEVPATTLTTAATSTEKTEIKPVIPNPFGHAE